jgi:hypothetical protein
MNIRTNTTGEAKSLEKLAIQENKMFIRIFHPSGKFINLLIDLKDVENYGLGAILEVINPDQDWLRAKEEFTKIELKQKKQHRKIAA